MTEERVLRDPRNPDPRYMVSSGSTNPLHSDMRKTLVLLRICSIDGDIYFVVEGVTSYPVENINDKDEYFYNEHTCPTNFIRIPLIAHNGSLDPHGVFEHVETVWMMDEYEVAKNEGAEEDYLAEVWPILLKTAD